ncbi:hypothetical protein J1614_008903 [Plenodomus biglobosus]|nr:hypothetical protein J1614_008903 [Plenodomus biglobosus]
MASGVNEMMATSVEEAIGGLVSMLDMAVTGVEEIVLFVIHMMTSTYLCLITLAVHESVKSVSEFSNKAANELREKMDELSISLSDTSKAIADSLSSIKNKMDSVPFMDDIKIPTVDLTDAINKVKSLELSLDLQNGMSELNSSIPEFQDIQDLVDKVIKIPFEEVKSQIQGIGTFHFNRTLLPVPQRTQLDFCTNSNSISAFFEGLTQKLVISRMIILSVLVSLAVLAALAVAWIEASQGREIDSAKEILKHRASGANVARSHASISDTHRTLLLQPQPTYLFPLGLWLRRKFGDRRSQKDAIDWLFAYATSSPMLFVLTIGMAGLLSCMAQYLFIESVRSAGPQLTSQVADFSGHVLKSMNESSVWWSNGVNNAILAVDEKLNHDIFGIVNTTTSAVNSSLDVFVENTAETLEDAFGGTILHDPIKEVLNCLIGLKIASFQKGLTWIHDHAHVSLPSVGSNTFTLGAIKQLDNSRSAADLLANANNAGEDAVTKALSRVIDKLLSGILTETIIYSTLVCSWLLCVGFGVIYIIVTLATVNQNRFSVSYPMRIPSEALQDIQPFGRQGVGSDLNRNQAGNI